MNDQSIIPLIILIVAGFIILRFVTRILIKTILILIIVGIFIYMLLANGGSIF